MNKFGLTSVAILTCIVGGYILGAEKLRKYVNSVSDFPIGRWWNFCIKFLTPAILGVSIILVLHERVASPYGGYPLTALAIGWLLFLALPVIAFTISHRGRTRCQ